MLSQTEATFLLATQRGCSQNAAYRSFHTFNFGSYAHPHRQANGNLLVFNDETLSGAHSMNYTAEEDCLVVLLPIVGAVNYTVGARHDGLVDVGEAYAFLALRDQTYRLTNPFKAELINYLHLRIRAQANDEVVNETGFDLDVDRNQLQPFLITAQHGGPYGYIGKFEGRREGHYTVKSSGKEVFACVIEGVFEIQDRLLETRDSLILHQTGTLTFEALSANAIILILEV